MSDDHSEYVEGQIVGLQHVCALLARRLFSSPAALTDFAIFLGQFEHDSWKGRHDSWKGRNASFLDGITNSFSEVSLLLHSEGEEKAARTD